MFLELRKLATVDKPLSRSLSTDESDCPTGVYKGCECQNDVGIFALESADFSRSFYFYTTWSYLIGIIALVIALVIRFKIAGLDSFAKRWRKVWITIYVFILFAVINALTVMIVSSIILGKADGLEADGCPYTMELNILTDNLYYDFIVHNTPVMLAFVTMSIIIHDISRPIQSKVKLFGAMITVFLVLTTLYMSVPVEGRRFFDKLEYIYHTDIKNIVGPFLLSFAFFSAVIIYMDK